MGSIPPAPTLVPGQLLDRYELLCPVAQGGMAQVWVARMQGKLGFERLVAIKTVIAEHALDDKFEKMFLDEARIIERIRHPNVAQILDLGQQGSLLFLVLEWVEGESAASLRRAVHGKGEKIPLNVVLRILADSCAGLHAAHELVNDHGEPLGVVHRDVSPSNVLVSSSGEVKLIDFGVAKAVDRISEETAAGVIKGKVAYMSPEQALGKAVDRRADIWSAGIMLYHLLAGRTPYEADNQIATLHRVVQGLPPDPIRGIPPEVAEIAYTALSYAADGRYATADEMQRALERTIVKCCGPTTQADVAAYLSAKMPERIARRKRTIQRALDASVQRKELAQEFETAIEQSSSSMFAALELRTPSSMQGIARATVSSSAEIDALMGDDSAVGPDVDDAVPLRHLEIPAANASGSETSSPAFSDAPTLKKPPTNLPEMPLPPSVARAPGQLPPIPQPPSDRPPPAAEGDAPLPPIPRAPPPDVPPPDAPPATEPDATRLAKTQPPTGSGAPATLPGTTRRASTRPASTRPASTRPASTRPASTRPAAKMAVPTPVITEAEPAPSPREFQSIPDTAKFGTRRRGPLIVFGFAVALLVFGYGAYLVWDKVDTERRLAPP